MKHQIALSMTLLSLALTGQGTIPDGHLERINALQAKKGKPALTAEDVLVRPVRLFGNQLTSYFTRIRDEDLRLLASQINDNGGPALSAHVTDETPIGTFYAAQVTPGGGDVLWLDTWVYFLNDPEGQALVRRIDMGVINEASIGYWYERNVCSITGLDYWDSPYWAGYEYDVTDVQTGQTTTQLCFLWTIGNVEFAEGSLVYRGAYPGTQVGGDIGVDVGQMAQNGKPVAAPTQTRFQLAAARDMAQSFDKKAQANSGPGKPTDPASAVNAADSAAKGDDVKIKLKMPDGTVQEFEPGEVQAELDRQLTLAGKASADTARSEATSAELSRIGALLGLKPEDLNDKALETLALEAGDGRTYREDLLGRLERVTVTLEGNAETGQKAAERALRLYRKAEVADLRDEVERLEAKRDTTVPNVQLSEDQADEGARPKAKPAFDDV